MKGCRRCVWLGLLFSACIHAAIATALLRVDAPASTALAERVVTLDLALFGDGKEGDPAEPMAAPAARETPETGIAPSDPAPIQEQPFEPALEPDVSQDERPLPDLAPDERVEPEPTPPLAVRASRDPLASGVQAVETTARLEPKPKAPSRPQASVKSKPKPVAKSKPKPKPKPTVKPPVMAKKSEPMTAAATRSGATRNPRSDSGAAAGAGKSVQPSGSGGKSATAARDRSEQDYLTALRQAIARHQNYPVESRRREQTGIATVAFVIRADGRIDRVQLAQGSGQPALDRAALDALRRLGRFKPIPTSLGRQSWPLRVPIRFDLK
ncbi:hypothetical protein CCR95_19245 [Thiocystis minor]|uniref:energy transducer TonB n=1 Tax=Thiocystis minor TaxID=61597 RepID=UPI00191309B8|nr:energy transducer TonB [Thiocystis minor]MBK5966157.1 hypothetical protein [Thiocystis minor]